MAPRVGRAIAFDVSAYLWHLYPTAGRGDLRMPDCFLPDRIPTDEALPVFNWQAAQFCLRQCYPNGIARS